MESLSIGVERFREQHRSIHPTKHIAIFSGEAKMRRMKASGMDSSGKQSDRRFLKESINQKPNDFPGKSQISDAGSRKYTHFFYM